MPTSPPPPLQKHPIRGRANLWIKKMRQSEDAKSVVTELTNHRAQQGGSHIWSRQSEQAIFFAIQKEKKIGHLQSFFRLDTGKDLLKIS